MLLARFRLQFDLRKPNASAMETHKLPQPQVLLPRKARLLTALYGEELSISDKFEFLKAYESALPLHQFLTTHAPSIQAIWSDPETPIRAEMLKLLPELRLVVTTSAGLDYVDLEECRRRGVVVANSGTVFSEDVADMAVGLLISVFKKICAANRFVRQGLWPAQGEFPLASKLGGKRIGIVGFGSIGSEVAKRFEAFGCIISYISRKKKPNVSYTFYSDVCELASNSDALVICCALTDQTRHMINKQVLMALGKKGVVVNVGRGAIIDEKEMVKCLIQGEIGGAGLDVFENEPDVPKELFDLDNVVLSPHRAVFTPESLNKVSGKRIGIVGLGKIGSRVAQRLEQFRCIISYNSRNRNPSVPYTFYSNVRCPDHLLCINGSNPPFDQKEGVVVNIARGSVIDEQELVRCLMEGEIRGAGLDVFASEPNVPKELFGLENVVLSPHCAAFTVESFKDLQQLVVGNLEAFFSNKPLLYAVALD